jgi:hypothetical protein
MSADQVDYSKVKVSEFKSVRLLAERIATVLATEPRSVGLPQFREFVKGEILNGAKNLLYDRALTATEDSLPQILQEGETFCRGFESFLLDVQGGKEAVEKRSRELAEHIRAGLAHAQATLDAHSAPIVDAPTGIRMADDDIAKANGLEGIVEYAAKHFGAEVTTRTIQNWRDSGALRMTQRGPLWEFSRSDLEGLATKKDRKKRF